jgi:hypothetical protein
MPALAASTSAACVRVSRRPAQPQRCAAARAHAQQQPAAAPTHAAAALPRRAALAAALSLAALRPLTARAEGGEAPPAFVSGPSGLKYADTVVGNGPEPLKGEVVKVAYVGTLTDSGAHLTRACARVQQRGEKREIDAPAACNRTGQTMTPAAGAAQARNLTRRASSRSASATARCARGRAATACTPDLHRDTVCFACVSAQPAAPSSSSH